MLPMSCATNRAGQIERGALDPKPNPRIDRPGLADVVDPRAAMRDIPDRDVVNSAADKHRCAAVDINCCDASRRSTSEVEVRITRTSVVRGSSTFLPISIEPSRISDARRPVSTASRETEAICVATSRAASEVSATVREISNVVAFCSSMASARRSQTSLAEIRRFRIIRISRCTGVNVTF